MAASKYWVSWYSPEEIGGWELHSPWWISGSRDSDGAVTICAAIQADSPFAAQAIVRKSYDLPPPDIEWRFCEERPNDWTPFSQRFPRADWMQWEDANGSKTPDRK